MHIGYHQRKGLKATQLKVLILASSPHGEAIRRLVEGAEESFLQAEGERGNLTVRILSPGDNLLEVAKESAWSRSYHAIVVLEALLRDEVADPDTYSTEQTIFLSQLSVDTGAIITTGTICASTKAQIDERIGGKAGHKGKEAITAAIEVSLAQREIEMNSEALADAEGILILGAAWHDDQVSQLVDAAKSQAVVEGVSERNILTIRAAGSLELPFLAALGIKTGKFRAVLCFGLVLVGGTNHADVLHHTIQQEFKRISEKWGIPVLDGTLFVSSYEEAQMFLGSDESNKGRTLMKVFLEQAPCI